MSWYKILKVKPCASYEDLRAAFKRRVLETHPDKGGRASDFRQVMLAFEKALAEKASAQRGETRAPWTFRNEANKSKPRSKAGVPKPCKNRSSRRPRHGGKGGGNRQGALIARLHSYLRQLQREDRRIAIAEKLGERHRVALELWIQANQWGSAPRQSEPDDLPGPDRKPKKAKCGENSKVPPLALEAPVEPQEMGTSKCHPSKGIVARQTRLYPLYHVIVVFNNLELLAGGTSDLAKAVDLHMALTSLKQRILKTPSLWYRLRDELEKVMLEHDLLLSEVRMSFRLHFPVHHWIGSGLRSPTYSIAELTMGLSVWQTLQKSRLPYTGHGAKRGGIFYQNSPEEVERAWQQISEVFVDIWVNAGSHELQIRRKLAALRRKYEAHGMQQLAQWNRYRMVQEEHRQRLCDRLMRQLEERERRKAGQVAVFTARVFGKIEKLLKRWDRMEKI